MKHRVDGSVVVVANASTPEGRDAALNFARRGWFVVLGGGNDAALNDLKRSIQMNGGVAHLVATDITTRAGRLRLIHEARAWFGHIDEWIEDGRMPEKVTTNNAKWKRLLVATSAVVAVGIIATRLRGHTP